MANHTQTVRTVSGVAVKRSVVNASSADAAGVAIVAAVAGKRIAVLAACLIAAGDVTATFYSGPADSGTALTGGLALAASGGFVIGPPSDPELAWIVTAPGQQLTVLLSGAVAVSGWIVYAEVD